jgi:hypothetical protein
LRLVLAAGFTRRQVALGDEALRSGGVEGGIVGSGGGQPVDVPIEHAERRRDQDGVVDLLVGRACRPGLGDQLSGDAEPTVPGGRRDASKVFSLAGTGALLASERTWSTSAMPPGSWAAAHAECNAEQYRHSFSVDT